MTNSASDVAFSPVVKAIQEQRGSREFYAQKDFRDTSSSWITRAARG